MVPTARLELAQLSPLPPQDSVSTNFTTSAHLNNKYYDSKPKIIARLQSCRSCDRANYFAAGALAGDSAAGVAGAAVAGTAAAGTAVAGAVAPGTAP